MKKGNKFTIRNLTISGEPFIEGEATLVCPHLNTNSDDDYEVWYVRFPGESDTYIRKV